MQEECINKVDNNNRALLIIVVDQSSSMAGMINCDGRVISKAEMASEMANELISELVERSRSCGSIQDYYDVAIIGYSDDEVRLLHGDGDWVSITVLDDKFIDKPTLFRDHVLADGTPQILDYSMRRWVIPQSAGSTPMYEAFLMVLDTAKRWCSMAENRDNMAPLVVNMTDGESTDCDYDDIIDIASRVKAVSTRQGNTLLFNTYIATNSARQTELFPSTVDFESRRDVSRAMRALFYASSDIPEDLCSEVFDIKGDETLTTYKAMSCNSSAREFISILGIRL
ncbi:MAG: hypothetical protein SNF93_01665 [Rikenellaceae bacterium]